MNPLKQKIARILNDSAEKGLSSLDKNSPCAKALGRLDIETALREDIDKICEGINFSDSMKIVSLFVKLKTNPQETNKIKQSLKELSHAFLERIENEHGKLNVPAECREHLLSI